MIFCKFAFLKIYVASPAIGIKPRNTLIPILKSILAISNFGTFSEMASWIIYNDKKNTTISPISGIISKIAAIPKRTPKKLN